MKQLTLRAALLLVGMDKHIAGGGKSAGLMNKLAHGMEKLVHGIGKLVYGMGKSAYGIGRLVHRMETSVLDGKAGKWYAEAPYRSHKVSGKSCGHLSRISTCRESRRILLLTKTAPLLRAAAQYSIHLQKT